MRLSGILSVVLFAVSGCIPYRFSGGGLPSHVHTFAIATLDNQTATAELPRELSDALRAKMLERLGLREDTQAKANALVRGTIRQYEIDIPVGFSADNKNTTTATRSLELTVDLEMVDQVNGKTLWQKKGLVASAQYQERGEPTGRKQAIDKIVTALIEGSQSQW